MKKVLVYGAYDLDNLGDDYMMYQIDNVLKKNQIKPIYLDIAKKPINYFNISDNEKFNFPIYTKYKNKTIKLKEVIKWYFDKKNIEEISALIFMGGGYTNEKFGLAKIINMLILAKKFKKGNKKIYFTGQTVGPVNSKLYQFFLKKVYKCGDEIIVREKYSHEYLNSLKLKNKLVGDDAYLTENYESEQIKKDKIIFNYKDFSGYEEYKERYFKFLLEIAVKSNKEVWVIPFRSSENTKEYKVNYELYQYLCENNVKAKFTVERNIENFKNIFKTSTLVVGTAYHSIVLGLLFGNKVYSAYLGNFYKMKIKGILDWYGLSDTNCIDIKKIDDNKNIIVRQILNNSMDIEKNKEITKELTEKVKNAWGDLVKKITLGE